MRCSSIIATCVRQRRVRKRPLYAIVRDVRQGWPHGRGVRAGATCCVRARIKEDVAMILYNTLMGVASGAAMLLLVLFARQARRSDRLNEGFRPGAWAWAFLPLGLILVVLGVHMSLTWPLQPVPPSASPHCCRADNI